jgi:pyruvate dehydrogenase E1 component alpha subunit
VAASVPDVSAALSSPVEDDATFALRSLQQAHANNKRYDASDAELLKFYEQMVLIRRFEERRASSMAWA